MQAPRIRLWGTRAILIAAPLLLGFGCARLAHSWLLYPLIVLGGLSGLLVACLWQNSRPNYLQVTSCVPSQAEQPEEPNARQLNARFLANVSHECRTPLSTVIGYAECMLRGYDGPITEEQKRNLTVITRNANELLQMLEDVLQLAKVESGRIDLELQPFPIDSCLYSVVQSLQAESDQRGLQLDVDVQRDLPPLLGDPAKVRRIMLNLVQNAIKYTSEGGITIRATADLPYAQLTVEDTGAGIPAEELQHVFEPFYQGGIGKSGVGLGLSIVKNLVDAHAGRLEVESKVGQGTIFTLFLPLAIPELKAQIRGMLEQKLEPSRRDIAYRLYQWLDSPEEEQPWQEAGVPS